MFILPILCHWNVGDYRIGLWKVALSGTINGNGVLTSGGGQPRKMVLRPTVKQTGQKSGYQLTP